MTNKGLPELYNSLPPGQRHGHLNNKVKMYFFNDPGAEFFVLGYGHIVKIQYFFSSCPHWCMDQTVKVSTNDDQRMVCQNL